MQKISQQVIEKAYRSWVYFHWNIECEEVDERFFKMIDGPENYPIRDGSNYDPWDNYGDDEIPMVNDEQAKRLEMAAGPNCEVLFRAFYLKYGFKK